MIERKSLGLEEARRIIDAMVEYYSVTKPGRLGAHAVVDNVGDLICFAKMDGARPLHTEMAIKKAYFSAKMGSNTRDFGQFRQKQEYGSLEPIPHDGTVIPGGVVIKSSDGSIIGAVGSSGRPADEDEEVALVGAKVLESL